MTGTGGREASSMRVRVVCEVAEREERGAAAAVVIVVVVVMEVIVEMVEVVLEVNVEEEGKLEETESRRFGNVENLSKEVADEEMAGILVEEEAVHLSDPMVT